MSEYQCYEFVAIDQPLTQDEQAELRASSGVVYLTLHTHRAASLVTDVSAGYLTRRRGSGKPRLV